MATFPLIQPLDSKTFMKTVCHLYRVSVLKLLPLTFILVLLYDFMRFGGHLFAKQYAHLHLQLAMFGAIIFLPLTGTLFSLLDMIAKDQPILYWKLFILTCQRFLSLMGCLFSMLLFPIIILGICIGIYIFLALKHPTSIFLFIWPLCSIPLVFAAVVSKVLAPILVFVDEQNANDAEDKSEQLVKGHYWRTYVYSFYALLLVIFLALLRYLATSYFPGLKHASPLLIEGIAQFFLLFIAPWSVALMLTYKYDLQSRFALKVPKIPEITIKPVEPAGATQTKEDKFNF